MVGPSAKRQAIRMIVAEGFGNTAQACRALKLERSEVAPRNWATA